MSGLLPSGLHINKPAVFAIMAGLMLIVLLYKFLWVAGPVTSALPNSGLQSILGNEAKVKVLPYKVQDQLPGQAVVWNLTNLSNPPLMTDGIKQRLARKSEVIQVDVAGKKVSIYVQQVTYPETKVLADILFLHGQAFTSQNWKDIGALDLVASWGFRAVAIDLPGKGKSSAALDHTLVPQFLPSLVKTLQTHKPVIVAPSMSGMYAIPYLFTDPQTATDRAAAFVPVAPVATSVFTNAFPKSQIPTLIVYGSKDASAPKVLQDLRTLPKGIIAQVPEAGHPCYMDKPADFFKYLYAFLHQLKL